MMFQSRISILATAALAGALLIAGGCSDNSLPLLSGAQLNSSGNGNEWILINYWATWCTPCREEIPELNRIDQSPGVRVVGVNFDQLAGDELRRAVTEMGIEFDVALTDPRPLWNYEMPQALPATLVISPAGEVTASLLGPQTGETVRNAMTK